MRPALNIGCASILIGGHTMASSGEQPRKAFDLRDEILKKLAQAKGICEVIRGNPDAKAINESISDRCRP
jgi:hypothetical protein